MLVFNIVPLIMELIHSLVPGRRPLFSRRQLTPYNPDYLTSEATDHPPR
jgi:hypothetical protein